MNFTAIAGSVLPRAICSAGSNRVATKRLSSASLRVKSSRRISKQSSRAGKNRRDRCVILLRQSSQRFTRLRPCWNLALMICRATATVRDNSDMFSPLHDDTDIRRKAVFADTHWSVVLSAGQGNNRDAAQALEQLCRTYWSPLYVYIRRRGYESHDAQDLTQEFFARLLEKNYLGVSNQQRGRFRTFLIAALNHFLANEWDRTKAEKRGGKVQFISLDAKTAEDCFVKDIIPDASAERLFERRWAITLLDQVLAKLREEMVAAGKEGVF